MNHPYSINLRERQIVYFVLAALSFGVSLLMGMVFAAFQCAPPSWLDIPGAFTIFGLLSWWFDKQIWRWPFIRRIGVSTPILDGQWAGTARSSFDSFSDDHLIRVTIRQTWTTIAILATTEQSCSQSTTAAFNMGPESTLVYSFTNQPRAGAADTMHAHVGTASVRILPNELAGEYYSGRDRQNTGTITLRRIEVSRKRAKHK